jgi:hypothetical protein
VRSADRDPGATPGTDDQVLECLAHPRGPSPWVVVAICLLVPLPLTLIAGPYAYGFFVPRSPSRSTSAPADRVRYPRRVRTGLLLTGPHRSKRR